MICHLEEKLDNKSYSPIKYIFFSQNQYVAD